MYHKNRGIYYIVRFISLGTLAASVIGHYIEHFLPSNLLSVASLLADATSIDAPHYIEHFLPSNLLSGASLLASATVIDAPHYIEHFLPSNLLSGASL